MRGGQVPQQEALVLTDPRRVLQEIDPSISYVQARPLQEGVDPQVRPWRLGASAFSLMGFLALVVAGVGLHSVVSYRVAQRTHEIGVRIALGAGDAHVVFLVLRSSLGMTALGVVIGLGLALGSGSLVAPLLFDTSPHDPEVLAIVVVTMLLVAVLASLAPVARARRLSAMDALRSE
jgi:ABC-type antimicrobial peptide transport system permease subunit